MTFPRKVEPEMHEHQTGRFACRAIKPQPILADAKRYDAGAGEEAS